MNNEKMMVEIMNACYQQIIQKNEFKMESIEDLLPFGNVDVDVEGVDLNDYTIKVKLTLPPFVPALDDDGVLWYICTDKNLDVKYTEKDGKYYFVSSDENLLELLEKYKNEALE